MVPAIIPKEDFTDVSDDTSPTYPIYLTYLVIKAKEVRLVKEVISCGNAFQSKFRFIWIDLPAATLAQAAGNYADQETKDKPSLRLEC